MEELQELVDDSGNELTLRKLSSSSCPDLGALDANIKNIMNTIENFESKRIKNKYGIDSKKYSGKYLTVSKNNSERGTTCQYACNKIKDIINSLKEGTLSSTKAQEKRKKYAKILETSEKGLKSKIGETPTKTNALAENYAKEKALLNSQVNRLKSQITDGQKQLEEIKQKAPSDNGVIAAIESWVKSLSMKDVLTVAKMAATACAAPVAQYAYHWVVDQYFAGQ